MSFIAYFVWDHSSAMFPYNIPFINRPLLWYGFLFALGFYVGYLVLVYLLRRYFLLKPEFRKEDLRKIKHQTTRKAEQLTFYVIIGAIVGSRLGDVIFYQNWSDLARDPLLIIAVWQGGLASHGGAVGILIALWVFARRRKIPFWTTAIAAVFIRIGNFFNQEVLGTVTTLPCGVVFLRAADGGSTFPRHPAQLYEALGYLIVFGILLGYWHRHPPFKPIGRLTGLFLILVFAFRFLIEFIKVEQSVHLAPSSMLNMGQWLSLPFIALGLWLFFRK
jgi:phosphatidylglycerol:prolipoprotein diacylglycerol transferase